MKKRTINIFGYNVDIVDYGYAVYMYPHFNGNAEFKADKNGYKKLSSYLRSCMFFELL